MTEEQKPLFCDCGHAHDEHNHGGGCMHRNNINTKKLCTCDRYSQKRLNRVYGKDVRSALERLLS